MSEYCNKIKQPLSNIRRWISDLNLGNTPIASTLVSTLRPDTDVARAATSTQRDSDLTTEASAQDSLLHQRDSANMSASNTAIENSELETIKQSLDSIKVCSNISKTQMKEFREAFGFFDKDGDGFITKDELGIVMRSLGQFASEEELKEMLKEVDINGDGLFSFDEFVEIVSNYSGNTSGGNTNEEQELRDAFRIFDKHNRGYISASDLRAVLHCLGEDLSEDEIEDMIKEVDVDGDGRIDFNEFVRALGEPDEADDDEGDSKPQD